MNNFEVAVVARQRRLQDLVQRLIDTEAEIEQLGNGQIDAVVSPIFGPILLRDARESLRISERRFRAVFDNAMEAMLVADDDGHYVDANPAACTLFGLPRSELLGKRAADFAAPAQDAEADWKAFLAVGAIRGEFVLLRPDGSRRITEFSATPNIMPGHHLSILRDVTARKEAESQLQGLTAEVRAQAQQLQQVMDMAPMGLFLLDHQARIVLANRRAQAKLRLIANVGIGDTVRQLAGRPLRDFLKPAEAGTLPIELLIDEPEKRVFRVLANPVTLNDQEFGWVLLLQDVTLEHKRQESAQQQDRLAAIGQLAAGIAHDFNNSLAVIILYTQMIQRNTHLNQGEQKRLAVILEQASQSGQLVRQILDFSRQSTMELHSMDLGDSLEAMVAVWKHTLPEAIRIVWRGAASGEYIVNVDATRIHQVLMNLVVNARDAMPQGGELHIELSHLHVEAGTPAPLSEMGPGEWVAIVVRDTGSGIAAEYLAHIFDPFFTTKGFGKGTGLGLAQVYGLVRQHGGAIGVQSQVGQGTTFTIYLLSAQVPLPEAEPEDALLK